MGLKKVNILGEEYTISVIDRKNDDRLSTRDGYVDCSIKKIVLADVTKEIDNDTIADVRSYSNVVMRHEICHAMFHESGLRDSCDFAVNEMCVDWIASQFPKLQQIFWECGCLE